MPSGSKTDNPKQASSSAEVREVAKTTSRTSDITEKYEAIVSANYWYHNTSLGDNLYVPYLQIDITNNQNKAADKINVKVIFYNEAKKEVWDEKSTTVIGASDTALKSGYKKTAHIQSGIGYKDQLDLTRLPLLTAEIYINGEFYGTVDVLKTYENYSLRMNPRKEAIIKEGMDKSAKEQVIIEAVSNKTEETLYRTYTMGNYSGCVISYISKDVQLVYDETTNQFSGNVTGVFSFLGKKNKDIREQKFAYSFNGLVSDDGYVEVVLDEAKANNTDATDIKSKIESLCTEQALDSLQSTVNTIKSRMNGNIYALNDTDADVRFNEQTKKFAAVINTKYVFDVYGEVSHNCCYIGHVDGTDVIVEKSPEAPENISDFWEEYSDYYIDNE